MEIVHQISDSTKKSELKNVEFCTTFCWFYWKCAKLSLKHLSSHLLLTNDFLKQGQFFSSVWEFYNLLTCCKNQNSKKCIFVPVAWVFVKHYKNQKMQKKSDSAVHIWMPFTKIDATGTFVNFFEFWFFLWARNLEFYYHLENFEASQKIELRVGVWIGGHFYWRHG